MSTLSLMTVREVASLLSASGRTVERAVDAGELPVVRIGRAVRIAPEDLRLFVQRNTTLRDTKEQS